MQFLFCFDFFFLKNTPYRCSISRQRNISAEEEIIIPEVYRQNKIRWQASATEESRRKNTRTVLFLEKESNRSGGSEVVVYFSMRKRPIALLVLR